MPKRSAFWISAAFCLLFWPWQAYGQSVRRPMNKPGVRQADNQFNAPIDAPAKSRRQPTDPAKLKQEAEELAKLAAAIPPQIDQVNQGQLPKDLTEQIKRIEKLAKRLRSEVQP